MYFSLSALCPLALSIITVIPFTTANLIVGSEHEKIKVAGGHAILRPDDKAWTPQPYAMELGPGVSFSVLRTVREPGKPWDQWVMARCRVESAPKGRNAEIGFTAYSPNHPDPDAWRKIELSFCKCRDGTHVKCWYEGSSGGDLKCGSIGSNDC